MGPSKPLAQPRRNIVGCRIQHIWKEGSKSSQWKGTVLDQVPVNPSLYLIKYDGFDCIYGLELHTDERVQGLEVLPDRVGRSSRKPVGFTNICLILWLKSILTFTCSMSWTSKRHIWSPAKTKWHMSFQITITRVHVFGSYIPAFV